MNRSVVPSTIVMSAALVWAVAEGVVAHRASVERLRVQAQLASASAMTAEIMELRLKDAQLEVGAKPASDLVNQVTSTLDRAHVPASRFKSLTQESDTALRQPEGGAARSMRKQTLRLALEDISVSELGAFLDEWRNAQRVWIVIDISLNHVEAGTKKAAAPTEQYRATLTLAALYIDTQEIEGMGT